MFDECPVCGLKYEREQGYFLGAMYIGYGLGVPLLFGLFALFYFAAGWEWSTSLLVAALAFLPFTPAIAVLSRVLWIHIDRAFDPD